MMVVVLTTMIKSSQTEGKGKEDPNQRRVKMMYVYPTGSRSDANTFFHVTRP